MKLKTPIEYGFVRCGKICLFQQGPLSQEWGAFDGGGGFIPIEEDIFADVTFRFNCVTQWMLSAKAVVMNDEISMRLIMNERSPENQETLSREIKNYNAVLWDKHKYKAIYHGNHWKFSQNPELKEFLLSFPRQTFFGHAIKHDAELGIGLDISDKLALTRKNWTGENLLGRVIQEIHREFWKEKVTD
jgi:hypothetical protein